MSGRTAQGRGSGLLTPVLVLLVGLVGYVFLFDHDDSLDLDPAAPVHLAIAQLGVDAAVQPVRLSAAGVLDPPEDVERIGWWRGSAMPGAGTGRTVLTGHSVHTGGGVLDDLGALEVGRSLTVRTGTGAMRYRVTGVTVLSREQVTARAERLFGQAGGDGRLVVVSCTDWDGAEYRRNVIVTASPVRATPVAEAADRPD